MKDAASTRFLRVMELFEAARCIQGTEREAFLAEETHRESPGLITEVRRLLDVHDKHHGPLDAPVLDRLERAIGNYENQLPRSERIQRYRVLRDIGTGGMGVVYLAEQDNPRREVAVKVIRSGLVNRELQRRFELEAALLGQLDHQGIAKIYEAGMYDDPAAPGMSRPYFAMEFVAGPPLLDYLDQNDMDLRSRLNLFALICDAVHHAHQKSIVHRDLKPGNILIRNDGQPKILDFGVARVTGLDVRLTTLQTDAGQLVGTLQYMSPEQVEGNAHSVDTRSDVYSLGVILYQVLTGKLPYDLSDCSIAVAARMITETEPVPIDAENRALRGELNTVVFKALQKNPELRYQSAFELQSDVRRFLNNEPIAARPASTMYLLSKFARRNRALVAGVLIAAFALSAGTVAATVGMLRAQQQAAQTHAMNEYLESVLIAADVVRSGDMRLVDLLKEASGRVDKEFEDYPDLAIRVHQMLATAFHNISLDSESEHHARRWLNLVENRSGRLHPDVRHPRHSLAQTLSDLARITEAEQVIKVAFDIDQDLPIDEASIDVRTMYGQIINFRGRYDESSTVLRTALEEAEAEFGPFHRLTIRAAYSLAHALDNCAMHGNDKTEIKQLLRDEAVELYKRVIEDEKHLPLTYNDGIHARMRLSDHYARTGDVENAIDYAKDALDFAIKVRGPDHPLLSQVRQRMIGALYKAGRLEEAAQQIEELIEQNLLSEGRSVEVIIRMADSLHILEAGKRFEPALEYAQILSERFGDSEHGGFGFDYQVWVAYLQTRLGDLDAAAPLFDALLANEDQATEPQRARLHYARGVWHTERDERQKARAHFQLALNLYGTTPHFWPSFETIAAELKRVEDKGVERNTVQ